MPAGIKPDNSPQEHAEVTRNKVANDPGAQKIILQDSLADLPAAEVNNLYFEGFQYVGPEVYEQKTGEQLDRMPSHPKDPSAAEWEEDDLSKLFPKLAAKYEDNI